MDVLKKIEQELKENVDKNFKTNIGQISDKYAFLTIFDDENNEYNIVNNNGKLSFRVSGFESADPAKIKQLKEVIMCFQFYNRKNNFNK